MVRDAELDEEPGRGRNLLKVEEMANDRKPSCGYLEWRTAAAEQGGGWWSVQARGRVIAGMYSSGESHR